MDRWEEQGVNVKKKKKRIESHRRDLVNAASISGSQGLRLFRRRVIHQSSFIDATSITFDAIFRESTRAPSIVRRIKRGLSANISPADDDSAYRSGPSFRFRQFFPQIATFFSLSFSFPRFHSLAEPFIVTRESSHIFESVIFSLPLGENLRG